MNKAVFKHILQTYGRKPGVWIGLIAETFRALVMRVYIVIAMAQVTASIASGDLVSAKKYTLYFFASAVAATIVGALGEIISIKTENQEYEVRMMSFYKKLVGKDVSFYRDNQTGYLTSIFRQYLDSILQFIRLIRGDILATTISLIVPPIVLFLASPLIGFISVLIVIVQFFYVVWTSSKLNKYREASHEIYRQVTGEVSDIVTNIIAFKAGGVEDKAQSKMSDLTKEETKAFDFRRTRATLYDLPRGLITTFGITAAIYLIIVQASGLNSESIGLMVLTITYMFQIVRNVGALPDFMTQIDDFITKIHPTLKYLGYEYEKIRDPKHPKKLKITEGAINLENIHFSYPSRSQKGVEIPVFSGLTLKIAGGEHVGVVGLSGAGKSTLANLLLRFDDIDDGSIKIDGIDIRDVRQSDLRANIGYVPQEPLLFHRTIKENIAYYNKYQSDEEIIKAAKAAHAHEFIEKLPDRYDSIVGERGIKLSGGQKQRIAIARAILKKAPILIFDEATSALDSESEKIIQRALPEIIGKQTAIVVAHRLSTIAGLDRIIVMHEGKIVESGTHQELLDLKGRYHSLWQKQTAEFGNSHEVSS